MAAQTLSPHPLPRGFVELDERVLASVGSGPSGLGGRSGAILVLAPTAEIAEAAGAHIARRTAVKGHTVLTARPRLPPSRSSLPPGTSAGRHGPLFSDVMAQLGLSGSCDVGRCAREIAQLGVTLLLPLPRPGTWDRALLQELVRAMVAADVSVASQTFSQPFSSGGVSPMSLSPVSLSPVSQGLLVLLSSTGDPADDLEVETYDVGEKMTAEGRRRWFAAVAEQACADVGTEDLATLDSSFSHVQSRILDVERGQRALQGGQSLIAALELSGRAWPVHELSALGADTSALPLLTQAGAVRCARGFVSIDAAWQDEAGALAKAAGREAILAVAAALGGAGTSARFAEDAWAQTHRADLFLRAEDYPAADAAIAAAVRFADDPLARREIVAAWTELLRPLPSEAKVNLALRSAERALAAGRAEEAYHWAELAATLRADDPYVSLLFGRANVATGDLVAASVAFERGAAQTNAQTSSRANSPASSPTNPAQIPSTTSRAMLQLFEVEQAEVAYLRGALDEASQRALRVVAQEPQVNTLLEARNTLGKILLARSAWDEADRHFEEDAWLASSHALPTAELRARSNRAIALLSRGLIDKARALFEAVLVEGERHGEVRACAFALDNLAVVASHQHQYVAALELWERAFKLRQQLGDRTALTHILGNLALIRVKLGLWDHAEHAVAFGRRMLGPGTPVARSAYFALCSARVSLMRGRTMQARREVQSAIPESRASGNAKYLAEALRLMARIELEEGDLVRAREALDLAKESLTTEEGRAETAILEASLARASGELDTKAAAAALALARLTDSEELVIEAETLLAEIHRADGDGDLARKHLDQAIALRDQVVSSLPDDIRPAYLSRPDSMALDRLDVALREPVQSSPESMTLPPRSIVPRIEPARILVGQDTTIKTLLSAVKKVALSSCTVLIRGESGTGKELVARAVHSASDRADGPLVTVNCAALVETLLLSELFGHEKGAFTGAAARRRGRFELAEGGTLFLDEIGDISPRTQVALLRVLQDRTFERVGGTIPIRVDVRILCATHRDLKGMVERGEFRQDLYYRLRGVTLDVPPLRARLTDLPLLGDHLLGRIGSERGEPKKALSADALDLLSRHRWPGNVRELENALRAASLFAEGMVINANDLIVNVDDLRAIAETPPSSMRVGPNGPEAEGEGGLATTVAYAQVRGGAASLSDIKRQIERDCIARALAETKGNITRAAVLLGMKRPRLSQLVKHYGLSHASSSEAS